MRHRKKGKILSRRVGPRKALLRSLSAGLILNEKITTTEAKAKTVRPIAERLITRAKENNINNYRRINAYLQNREAVKKLLEEIGPRYKERPGGYTRIIKTGQRRGDAAQMAIIELV
ncbi:50S ribosomal protein L17 [Patescibacteria group bacterium AH-259-L05]|nr:50S ribosomal protein L17 [Patescibacteria group bacterium AH-259-L05]